MSGYVYLMKCNNRYKIGIARDVIKRRAAIQTGNPYDVLIVQHKEFDEPIAIEKELHRKYAKSNIGGEWFELSRDDVDWLIEYLGGQPTKRTRVKELTQAKAAPHVLQDDSREPMPPCHWITSRHPRRNKYLLSKSDGLDILSSHIAMSGEDLEIGNYGASVSINGFANPNNVMYAMKVLEDAQMCVVFGVCDGNVSMVVYGANLCTEPNGKRYFAPAVEVPDVETAG